MAFRLPELGSTRPPLHLPSLISFQPCCFPSLFFQLVSRVCSGPLHLLSLLPRMHLAPFLVFPYLGHLLREAIPDPSLSVPSHHFIILHKPFTSFPIYVLVC